MYVENAQGPDAKLVWHTVTPEPAARYRAMQAIPIEGYIMELIRMGATERILGWLYRNEG